MSQGSESFVFFWGGNFSQWAKAPMEIDGVQYNCCEQHMMAEKARLFGDMAALATIMKTKNPKEQKAAGRKVKGFDTEKWNRVAREIVYRGNYAKFSQNPALLTELAGTGDKIIVEASPSDAIWGIGLAADDPRARDRAQWRGTNWLGEAIMRVREQLRMEGKLSPL
jgi:ribA/ribD-fused uncharacterized protein